MTTRYIAFADGACSGNPGPGGWAYAIWANETSRPTAMGRGGEPATTNNRMEIEAVAGLLRRLIDDPAFNYRPGRVDIFLDSEYVQKGITEWLAGWKARGWRNASKKEVANRDLWEAIDELLDGAREAGYELHFGWVRGHAGNERNELVDRLACQARDEAASRAARAPQPNNDADGEDGESAVTLAQVATMKAILDGFSRGDFAVKDVIRQIRERRDDLGIV